MEGDSQSSLEFKWTWVWKLRASREKGAAWAKPAEPVPSDTGSEEQACVCAGAWGLGGHEPLWDDCQRHRFPLASVRQEESPGPGICPDGDVRATQAPELPSPVSRQVPPGPTPSLSPTITAFLAESGLLPAR